jgi:DNA-binding IscR family transcriptional regulator
MRTDSRLSRMLHVLLHMARQSGPFTSERIAGMLNTNAVVVRRTMAGLRDAGFVASVPGPGGGWNLSCDLTTTTLLSIHRAVSGTRLFSIGTDHAHPDCAVERVVNSAVGAAIARAETMLTESLGAVTLAALAEQFDAIVVAAERSKHPLPWTG